MRAMAVLWVLLGLLIGVGATLAAQRWGRSSQDRNVAGAAPRREPSGDSVPKIPMAKLPGEFLIPRPDSAQDTSWAPPPRPVSASSGSGDRHRSSRSSGSLAALVGVASDSLRPGPGFREYHPSSVPPAAEQWSVIMPGGDELRLVPDELRRLLGEGTIGGDTLVRKAGMAAYAPIGAFREFGKDHQPGTES